MTAIHYTLPQKKSNFSEVNTFLFGKSVSVSEIDPGSGSENVLDTLLRVNNLQTC